MVKNLELNGAKQNYFWHHVQYGIWLWYEIHMFVLNDDKQKYNFFALKVLLDKFGLH